jgi:hypothetical protein
VNSGLRNAQGTDTDVFDIAGIIQDAMYTTWTPAPFDVNHSYAQTVWNAKDTPMVTFESSPAEEHKLDAWLIRDNDFQIPWSSNPVTKYNDYIVFQQTWGWLGTTTKHRVVPYEVIINNWDNDSECSKVFFQMRYSFLLVVTLGPGATIVPSIYEDEYNMTILVPLNNTDNFGPFDMMWKILTFNLPNTDNDYISALIAAPFYMCIAFVALEVVRRWVPLLGG